MKQFIRNFNKQKVVGLLNISSLSLGIMVAVIVGLWTINELNFDRFHKNREQIYRLVINATLNDSPIKIGSTFRPFGQEAADRIPQITDMTRLCIENSADIKIDNVLHTGEQIIVAVDDNFFSFFTFPILEGEPTSAPDKAVISRSGAQKYFPGKNPIGQSFSINSSNFTIAGVMKDIPDNSSIRGEIVVPPYGYYLSNVEWGDNDINLTFFTVPQPEDIPQIETSLKEILYHRLDLFKQMNGYVTLESLKDIHFSTGFMGDGVEKGNKPLILVFALVALVILIISCINFTNLFISTSFLRAKTIGVKKSHGADRNTLIFDFYLETACYVLISIAIGIFLAYLSFPIFNGFIQTNIQIDPISPELYSFLAILFVFTVLLAGTFPALYMTKFNPVQTLGGKFKGKNISVFQKSLIIIQFSASIALLIVVGFMQKQVDFMVNHDLGFDKENVLYIQGRENFAKNYETLRDEFLKDPAIKDVTLKNSLPTDWQQGWGIGNVGSSETAIMEMNYVMPNYFEFMDMKIIEGENPFYLESNDSIIPVVISESALHLLKLEPPINQIIIANGYQRMVVKGVMRNANIRSLRDEVDPQVYMKLNRSLWNPVFFKVTGDPQRAIDVVRAKWEELEPDYPFEYHFLDDTYKDLYASEMNAEKVLAFAMLITFIISVAGLFAMAFYVTQRRIKEIGLRKINGATLKDLLLLLNKDFVVWVLISFVIATPVAYFCLQSWLDGFTVKTPLSIWVFLLVGIIALAVALLTTSFQTWNVATMNPVKTLKNE
ncbi:MAG: ABC transporter permease [Dysgonamonadaceae bacterium]|jgi:putative ABC transport system permease protein|nr:ABC transporter permease [Dysgonamonadaceae bacterium]